MPAPIGTAGLMSTWNTMAGAALQIEREIAAPVLEQVHGRTDASEWPGSLEIKERLDGA